MSITRELVADLREGDVVEIGFASGAIIRGPVVEDRHTCALVIADAGWTVRLSGGAPGLGLERYASTLTVVSRAPRPLYVNHDREKPVDGDVVALGWAPDVVLMRTREYGWIDALGQEHDPKRKDDLRLLVDGETGQVVP